MRYVTLPVGLAYDMDLSTRWALGAQTSINTSFYVGGEGLLLDPKTLTLNSIESYGSKINPVLFTTDLGIYLKHKLTPYIDLQGGLAYRTSISPVFDESFGANSKASSYLMSAGLQFRIR